MQIGQWFSGYRLVYVDYAFRLLGQFVVFSLLIKSLTVSQFADYAFYLLVSTYIALVVNASFDSLINLHLANDKDSDIFYGQSLKLKFVLYGIFSIIFPIILNMYFLYFLYFALIGVMSVVLEHLDIKMRFLDNYTPIKYRIYLCLPFFVVKLILALWGEIESLLLLSAFEILLYIIFALKTVHLPIFFGNELDFIKQNGKKFIKVGMGSILIFSFLQLDQFLVYKFMQKEDYAVYALVCKFFVIFNTLVGVYARYLVPKLYSDAINYRLGLFKLLLVNVFVFVAVAIGFLGYLHFWIKDNFNAIWVLLILGIASIGLIFGQVRGVYFIKKQKFMPDIYNALFGIMVLLALFFYMMPTNIVFVAVCYFFGVMASGIVSTFFYKEGWKYLKLLKGN